MTPSTPIKLLSDWYVTARGTPETALVLLGHTTALSVVPEEGMEIAPV